MGFSYRLIELCVESFLNTKAISFFNKVNSGVISTILL